ncbi:ComF family protein [Cohnella kolymensis]|uniref:ComF family protein n=1 Tax=Cohnella kolymensis TaxID=1590652 RepID=UPI00069739A0|nr:ComF family protein [Cohnella kolymensis]
MRYDSLMKDWLALYKYRGHEKLEPVLAAMLAFAYERLNDELGSRNTYPFFHTITSVPLAPERLQERGFNQAERLAVQLSQWYGIRCRPLLARLRHTEKQSLKTRQSRVNDMMGNFAATSAVDSTDNLPNSVHRIILIDDVYTTGSTINECARVLKESSAPDSPAEIYGLLWARS